MKPTLLAATVLGGLACSMPARATLIEYQFSLSIIAAAGGGTMTGDFNYDAVTNLESNVSITIAGNAFGSGSSLDVTYTQVAPIAPPATTPFFNTASDIIIGKNGAAEAFLGFTAPLTPVGGEILLYGAVNASDTGFQQSSTDGLGLFATPVTTTEPASLAVLGVGLVGLSAKRRGGGPPPGRLSERGWPRRHLALGWEAEGQVWAGMPRNPACGSQTGPGLRRTVRSAGSHRRVIDPGQCPSSRHR